MKLQEFNNLLPNLARLSRCSDHAAPAAAMGFTWEFLLVKGLSTMRMAYITACNFSNEYASHKSTYVLCRHSSIHSQALIFTASAVLVVYHDSCSCQGYQYDTDTHINSYLNHIIEYISEIDFRAVFRTQFTTKSPENFDFDQINPHIKSLHSRFFIKFEQKGQHPGICKGLRL